MSRPSFWTEETLNTCWFIVLAASTLVSGFTGEKTAQAVYVLGMMLMWRLPKR